jgi:hypothetical protein
MSVATREGFRRLTSTLDSLQKSVVRRDGDPIPLFEKAGRALAADVRCLENQGKHAKPDEVSRLASCCSTLMKNPLPQSTANQLSRFFEDHLRSGAATLDSSTTILSTMIDLLQVERQFLPVGVELQHNLRYRETCEIAFGQSLALWDDVGGGNPAAFALPMRKVKASPKSLIAMLRGVDEVRCHNFVFYPSTTGSRSLLPIKCKRQMEAKLQKSGDGRRLLGALRSSTLTKIDAGTALNIMARTGIYDEETAAYCCDALIGQDVLLNSRQRTHILRNLGVLQHSAPRLLDLSLSGRIKFGDMETNDVRDYVQALAMVRADFSQQSSKVKELMDGIWMHTLRYKNANPNASDDSTGGQSGQRRPIGQHGRGASSSSNPPQQKSFLYSNLGGEAIDSASSAMDTELDQKPQPTYSPNVPNPKTGLPPSWLVDVNHALYELNVTHHKFMAHCARQLRTQVHRCTSQEWLKILYAFGAPKVKTTVPEDLQGTWETKVEKMVKVVAFKCGEETDFLRSQGRHVYSLTAADALRQAGIKEHPIYDLERDLRRQHNVPSAPAPPGVQTPAATFSPVTPKTSFSATAFGSPQAEPTTPASKQHNDAQDNRIDYVEAFIRRWPTSDGRQLLELISKVTAADFRSVAQGKNVPKLLKAYNSAVSHGGLSGASVAAEASSEYYRLLSVIVQAQALSFLSTKEVSETMIDFLQFPLAGAIDSDLSFPKACVSVVRGRLAAPPGSGTTIARPVFDDLVAVLQALNVSGDFDADIDLFSKPNPKL